ncbi:klarsicht protein-like [Hetaerina americana]|uniref:klarsicht protein-like n=1 Tax=Hetaerina americana TaxID=62018 RepID=UPI003A7F2C8D
MPVGFEVSAMKASFSLSSLDRSGGLTADSPEHARLRTEKPYNSLTKKPRRAWENEFDNWRHSLGSRDNDDSFLEPILPRIYTFLMDNTLIDTCKEAVGELCMDHKWQLLEEVAREGKASSSEVETLCLEAVEKEIRCLRHWIRDMEKRLRPMDFRTDFAPLELDDKAKEIQCLAVEVKAQGKVVAALILHCECLVAASAAEIQEQQRESQEEAEDSAEGAECEDDGRQIGTGSSEEVERGEQEVEEEAAALVVSAEGAHCPPRRLRPIGAKGNAADSLKVARWLEGRWHHLYLRALEWQCYIEELLSGGGHLPTKRRSQFNGDAPSPDREGGEQSPTSGSEGEGGGGGIRPEGGSEGGSGERRRASGSRRGRVGFGGGPLVKKPRTGVETPRRSTPPR